MRFDKIIESIDLPKKLLRASFRNGKSLDTSESMNRLLSSGSCSGKRSMSRQKEQENGNPQYRKSIGEVDLNNEPPKPEKIHFISYARKRMTQRESVPSGVEFNNQCQSRD